MAHIITHGFFAVTVSVGVAASGNGALNFITGLRVVWGALKGQVRR